VDNRDDTDIEGVDSDKDNNSDTDKDDSDIERIVIIFIGIYTFDIGIVSIIHFSIIKRNT
jgi:hypothetical protein